jgi:hypothetical protein
MTSRLKKYFLLLNFFYISSHASPTLNIKRLSEHIKIELGSIDFVKFNIENDVFEHVLIVWKNGKKHAKIQFWFGRRVSSSN